MKKLLRYYFEKSEKPIEIFVLSIVVLIVNECLNKFVDTRILSAAGIIFFTVAAFGMVLSAIYQFTKKQLRQGIITIFILFLCFFTVGIYFATAGDGFADHLKIPSDTQIEYPIHTFDNHSRDSVQSIKKINADFQLYCPGSPGIYEYDIWTDNTEPGIIYLKAFEITHKYELLSTKLGKSTRLRIDGNSDSIQRFSSRNDFTIYEGDWGKPYAARFEVWFMPENGGNERKLLSKNYIIEGWER